MSYACVWGGEAGAREYVIYLDFLGAQKLLIHTASGKMFACAVFIRMDSGVFVMIIHVSHLILEREARSMI